MKKTNQRLFYPQKVKRQLFCALVACAVCAIPVNAQSGTISLNKSNVSMHTIMQEVEGQSDYTFFYNDNLYLANLHTSFLCNLIYPTFSRILLYSC